MLAKGLHKKYRAKLAEAQELDRRKASLAFLESIKLIGGFEVSPLTLRRFLYLEVRKSPFLGGSDKPLSKEDVVSFLWAMAPEFELSDKKRDKFKRKHFFKFLFWQKIAVEMGSYILKMIEEEQVPTAQAESSSSLSSNWVAKLVDGAASQYGWTEDQILDLPLSRCMAYMKAMAARLSGEPQAEFSSNADEVRHWYMTQIEKHSKEDGK